MINLGSLTINPQGLLIFVAILASSYIFWREAVRRKYRSEGLFDFVLIILIAGIIGGRLLYFLTAQYFSLSNFLGVFMVWQGRGALWYGSFLGGLGAAIAYAHYNRWHVKKTLDLIAAALPLGMAIGLITLYPFEAVGFLVLFVGCVWLLRQTLPWGFITYVFLTGSSMIRFAAEFFRIEKSYLFGVDVNQAISIVVFVVGVVGLRKIAPEVRMKLTLPKLSKDQLKKWLEREEKHLAERQSSLKQEDPLLDPMRTTSNAELQDESAEEIEHRNAAANQNVVKTRLSQIQHALRRVNKGEYGKCERCGKPIDPERLQIDPSVTFCLSCQRIAEGEKPKDASI